MKLEKAIEQIFKFVGVKPMLVPQVVAIFRAAGVRGEVPSGTLKNVLEAGDKLKALGIK